MDRLSQESDTISLCCIWVPNHSITNHNCGSRWEWKYMLRTFLATVTRYNFKGVYACTFYIYVWTDLSTFPWLVGNRSRHVSKREGWPHVSILAQTKSTCRLTGSHNTAGKGLLKTWSTRNLRQQGTDFVQRLSVNLRHYNHNYSKLQASSHPWMEWNILSFNVK
jgi:hypothetical protein